MFYSEVYSNWCVLVNLLNIRTYAETNNILEECTYPIVRKESKQANDMWYCYAGSVCCGDSEAVAISLGQGFWSLKWFWVYTRQRILGNTFHAMDSFILKKALNVNMHSIFRECLLSLYIYFFFLGPFTLSLDRIFFIEKYLCDCWLSLL